MQENILQKIEDNAKKVACLYFIVEIIVFMIAGILLFCVQILAQADKKNPSPFDLHSCLRALVYCFHDQADIRLVCGF